MRIGVSVGTEAIGRPAPPSAFAEQARCAEDQGFASAWSVHFSRGIDSLSALLSAGATTSTIALGAGVVPIYPRHPVALAQQAATVQSLLGGRLTLGIGVSHQPVMEGMFGLPFARPAAYLQEYLAVLAPMLQTGKARFDGEFFQVDAEVTVPGTSPVPVLVGGLSAGMVRAGGGATSAEGGRGAARDGDRQRGRRSSGGSRHLRPLRGTRELPEAVRAGAG